MQRYANQAPYQHFLSEYDEMFGERIEHDLLVKEKKAERQRRIDAGETVSDTSSTKERKRKEKEEFLDSIRRKTTVNDPKASRRSRGNTSASKGNKAILIDNPESPGLF